MGWGTIEEVWDRSGSLGEFRDGSGDPLRGPGPDKGPSTRSGTGMGTFKEVWEG